MSNDRILRTLQQDVEIPEVVRKKADQAFAKIRAEQEETGMDNKKVVSYNKKRTGRKVFSKRSTDYKARRRNVYMGNTS